MSGLPVCKTVFSHCSLLHQLTHLHSRMVEDVLADRPRRTGHAEPLPEALQNLLLLLSLQVQALPEGAGYKSRTGEREEEHLYSGESW